MPRSKGSALRCPGTNCSLITFLRRIRHRARSTPRTAQTIRKAASWLHDFKYHNQCDGYLASLTELLTIMSRFVGTVNPAFGTSSVESVDVRIRLGFIYPFCGAADSSRASGLPFLARLPGHRLCGAIQGIRRRAHGMEGRHRRAPPWREEVQWSVHPLAATLSAAPDWLTPRSFFIAADPAIVMEITLIHW